MGKAGIQELNTIRHNELCATVRRVLDLLAEDHDVSDPMRHAGFLVWLRDPDGFAALTVRIAAQIEAEL